MSSIVYRQIEPFETAAVATLAREVFDQFVAPHYQPDGISEFHRYASADALSQRHGLGHVTLVAEHSGELVGMLHLRNLCHVSMLFVRPSFQHKARRSGTAYCCWHSRWRRRLRVHRQFVTERRFGLRTFRFSRHRRGAMYPGHPLHPDAKTEWSTAIRHDAQCNFVGRLCQMTGCLSLLSSSWKRLEVGEKLMCRDRDPFRRFGNGKTTIGKLLAQEVGWRFYEADDFHSQANINKMRRGIPLTDEDRSPWLEILRQLIERSLEAGENAVLACSALKRRYRERLHVSGEVKFVFLRGDCALIEKQLRQRRGHFMNPELLPTQVADLEEPKPDEDALRI